MSRIGNYEVSLNNKCIDRFKLNTENAVVCLYGLRAAGYALITDTDTVKSIAAKNLFDQLYTQIKYWSQSVRFKKEWQSTLTFST